MGKRKTSAGDNPNKEFCDFLNELAEYEKNVNRHAYKHNAYRKAASILAAHPIKITSGSEAKKLKGVGEKIAKKIDEYIETGKLEKLDNIHNDELGNAINILTSVTGIGPAKARKLYDSGIKTLSDLRNSTNELNHHQIIGLKYVDDFAKRIPRSEIELIEIIIKKDLQKMDPEIQITLCGSYRRGLSESGDIDILMTHPSHTIKNKSADGNENLLKSAIDNLINNGIITETLSLGHSKFMGACKLKGAEFTRRIDIRLIPYDQYYCGILYFTGSDIFNREMRAHALKAGFKLNEYTLQPLGSTGVPGEPVEISSERDIFECIDFPYREPQERSK